MDRTIALIRKSHEGDEKARTQLVEENAGLVWCIVKRFYNRGTEAEDLFQIGNIGLLKAIDKFDLSYDVKFSTYAVPMISGEIKRFLRDDGMIKVSRSLKELSYKAYLCKEKLCDKWGREPTITEIADELMVDREELAQALDAGGDVESLQKPIFQKDGQEIRLMDKLPEKERQEERILNHMLLGELLTSLDKEERRLIYLRYFADRTQTQVGEELGISQVQVSRLEKKILKRLRERIEKAYPCIFSKGIFHTTSVKKRKKGGVSMEEARRKLRICLIFVVALAILVGCVYYFGSGKNNESISEGTLVMSEIQKRGEEYGVKQ